MKRRSRQGVRTPRRPGSPAPEPQLDEAPPLPSPPPNRALPPTPPASGSEKAGKLKPIRAAEIQKELPGLPTGEIIVKATKQNERPPHISTQRKSGSFDGSLDAAQFHTRLEALEKQNVLLLAELSRVTMALRANTVVSPPLSELTEDTTVPMSWESRIARKSAASHGSNGSNGSALDMYTNARRTGSKHGR
jgi:hypothetical protein